MHKRPYLERMLRSSGLCSVSGIIQIHFWRVVNAQHATPKQAKHYVTWRATTNLFGHPFPVLLWCVWAFLPGCNCSHLSPITVCVLCLCFPTVLRQSVLWEPCPVSKKILVTISIECFFVGIHCQQSSIHVFHSSISRYEMKALNTCVPVLRRPFNKECFLLLNWLLLNLTDLLALLVFTC